MERIANGLLLYLLAVGLAISLPSNAEISRITVKWRSELCLAPCVNQVAKQLSRLPGTAELMINQNQGQADIRWKPRIPFSASYIRGAMGLAGPSIEDLRIKVRGTILSTPSTILLQSLGDETRFILLSPASGKANQFIPQETFETHLLTPSLREKFLEAEQAFVIAEVEGPLFDPFGSTGLYLIVEKVTFEQLAPPR